MPRWEGLAEIDELILLHRRRLRLLQRRAAIEGIAVDPMVIIQIEDTLATIDKLEQERAQLDVPAELERPAIRTRAEVELMLADARQPTPGQTDTMPHVLSYMLNLSAEQIISMQPNNGDGIMRLELPTVAANRLFALFRAGDYKLRGLGIQEVRLIYRLPFQSAPMLSKQIGRQPQRPETEQGVYTASEDGMNIKVLIVDNHSFYLDATARFLEVQGYDVYRAISLEQARHLLDYTWIHIALIDVRMRDDSDEKDASGLQLAKDPSYYSIPKIMLTQFPSYEYIRQALGPNLDGLPPAVHFLDKNEGTPAIVRALEQSFEQHVRLNRNLKITWNQPSTFTYLVNLIQPEQDNERLLDRAGELEDLFRKLFYDSAQITISRVLKHSVGWLLLEVFAYGKTGAERQFVVSCGRKNQIAEENRRYDDVAPQGAGVGGTVRQQSAETLRFAATPYMMVGGDLEETVPLRVYYQSQPAEAVVASLNHFYSATLPAWYNKGREQHEGASLSELYAHGLGLDTALLEADALRERVEAICRQMLAAGLVGGVDISADEIMLRFANGATIAVANPVAERYDERISPDVPLLYGIVHGSVGPDSILVDEQGQTWLVDFTRAGRGLLLQDFIVLETTMKLEMLGTLDMQVRYMLEEWLLDTATLSITAACEHLPSELRRMALAIGQIRASAVDLAGDQLTAYQVGMFFYALKYVATYDPVLRYTRRQLIPHAHGLLLAAMLYGILNRPLEPAQKQPLPILQLDTSNEVVWLGDHQIDLTPRGYQLLKFLYENAGRLCTRSAITKHMLATGYDPTDESWLNSLVNRLRSKIEPDPNHPRYLLTVHGRGYKLIVAPE